MSKLRQPNRAYAVAFGLLAATVGILAGGAPLPMRGLGGLFALLYMLAERRGWLAGSAEEHALRDYGVVAVFCALVAAFVLLTGGKQSPMPCALYLPVLLAALCYGIELGLTTSVAMILAASLLATGGHLPTELPSLRIVAVGLSFPVVAVFGGALRAQMERRLRALNSEKNDLVDLLDMSQMMDAAVDLDMTLNLILLNVQEHTQCRVCAVYLKAADGRTLELRAASGPPGPALLPALGIDEARGGGWAVDRPVQEGLNVQAFYRPDTSGAPSGGTSRLDCIDRTAQSFVCLPLAYAEGLLGMLYLSYREPQALDPDGVHRLELLATRAAFPLQRLLLQQDFRSLAYSDAMTGLDNFRQFEETLADELARAERYKRPLSVILLDIDHFKSFNDTRGHPAGDALLGQLGVVLRNALRSVDRPARYGGEEFVIICPETGAEEVRLIAERIRASIADTAFVLPGQGGDQKAETARVTVSLGCATYPTDARAGRDLVKKADIALYDSKAAGRNAVRAYSAGVIELNAA